MGDRAAGTPGHGLAACIAAAGIGVGISAVGIIAGCITVAGPLPAAAAEAAAEKLAVKRIFPAGGPACGTVVVKAEGTFPRWPVGVWTDRGGTAWKPREEKGSFDVTIAADAVGVHRVRIHDDREAAGIHRFVVGTVPETAETEPNDRPQEPQAIQSLPVTVNGVLEKAGDVDGYAVQLEAGQTLVAAVDAHEGLRAPLDAVLEIVDDRGGYHARNLDARGLDPRIVFRPSRPGRYVVRIYGFPAEPNSTIGHAGGPDHVYRLTLSTGGFLAATLPAAVARTGTTVVAASGWNLPAGLAPAPLAVAADPAGAVEQVWAAFPGVAAAVPLPVVATDRLPVAVADRLPVAAVERLPVVAAEPAAAVEPPLVASGLFTAAGATLVQRVAAKKSQPLLVAVEANGVGSEAEAVLDVRAADGPGADGRSLLAKSDRDPPAAWTPPADGDYLFAVRDRRGGSGPAHFFRLSILPAEPRLEAGSDTDAVAGKVGGTIELTITVERLRGWKDAVEFVLVDPPAGITAKPVTSAAEGDSAKKVTLVLEATAASSGPLRVAARRPQPAEGAAAEPVASVRFGKQKLPVLWVSVVPE